MSVKAIELPVLLWDDPDPSWRLDSACRGIYAELSFFSTYTQHVAKEQCAVCPVTDRCLEFAIKNNEPYGVWGGMSRKERVQYTEARV